MAGSERPDVPQPHLRRARLHALLDQAVRQPVTVVRAGPGWGKTVLAAAWAAGRPDVAWLTLRPGHATVPGLHAGVAAALRVAEVPGAGTKPAVLVLDDVQVLDGSPAMIALNDLIGRPESAPHLVLLTRTEPTLPPDGGRPEIRAADLAFDESEAAALAALLEGADAPLASLLDDAGAPLASLLDDADAPPASLLDDAGAPLPSLLEVAGAALTESEGWALGLRLTLEGAGPATIDDYLWGEVVAPLPSRIRRFLTRTSVTGETCPGLAESLTGVPDAHCVLHELERVTGFVTSHEPWFRYHAQLRSALRHRLETEFPEDVGRLHARAARWYAAERSVAAALHHAAAAADWVYLGELITELAVTRIISAERHVLVRTVQRIPPELLPTTPELALCAGLLMLFGGDFIAIPVWVRRSRAMLAGRPPAERLAVDTALDLLEIGTVLRVRGDMPVLVEAATRVLARLRRTNTGDLPLLHHFRAAAVNNKGVGLLWIGELDEAERLLWSALRSAREHGIELVELNAHGYLALLAYARGDLDRACEHGRSACAHAERLDLAATMQAAAGYLALALVEVARDNVAEAQDVLRAVLHVEGNPPEAALAVVTGVVRVQLLRSGGDPVAAATLLRQVRQEAAPTLDAPFLKKWLDCVERAIDEPAGPGLPGLEQPKPGDSKAGPLSERETEVLRFLPSVLTAQEIAGNLGVSVNTVKAHMRAIYRKLGAARRREAVDIARRRGLL